MARESFERISTILRFVFQALLICIHCLKPPLPFHRQAVVNEGQKQLGNFLLGLAAAQLTFVCVLNWPLPKELMGMFVE